MESSLKSTFDLSSLNESQRAAVEHIESPTLVLAGAGSGKTRVLTHKIAYLVSQGLKPWQILAVTFTNKAAREMVTRSEKLLNIPVQGLWIGTFHGICVRILRREADRFGFVRDFTIYDRDDQLAAVKKAMREMGITKDQLNPSRVIHIIGKAKNDFVSPGDLNRFVTGPDVKLYEGVYRRYEELLRAAGAFDFDDLITRTVGIFNSDKGTLEGWQQRFRHILIDEFQDTNLAQYLFMKLLSGGSGNVTVVGDDDQSIYSWRGADIKNILNFDDDFKKVATIRLEKNYRSTGVILKAANKVVSHNKSRMTKNLWTDRSDGEPIKILECWNDRDEAGRIISSIEKDKKESKCSLKDTVVLYRTNAQSRSFEDVLRRRGLPYVIVGGLRFYERKEIKDILAYLRLIINPNDAISFIRALTNPKRGIGQKTIEKIETFASGRGITLVDAIKKAEEILSSGNILKQLKKFGDLLELIAGMRGQSGLDIIAKTLVTKIRYAEYLENENPENYEERMDNVNELITAMGEFENITDEDDLSTFLAEVSLVADIDSWNDDTDALTLMTLHSAKGLEFPSVYIAGVERGLFPLPKAFDSQMELEEERRLFYVGITRAEDRLHISYALNRARQGSFSGGASMLVEELPDDVLEFEHAELSQKLSKPVRNHPVRRVMEFEDYPQESPDHDSNGPFRVGSYIRHPAFGRGKVTRCSGSGDDLTLTILFGAKEKKILAKFGNLVPG